MPPIKRAPTLTPSQLRHVLAVTNASSKHPERDVLALLLTHCAGLRCTETARLEIRDIFAVNDSRKLTHFTDESIFQI